ncbi:MAG: copper homeostasis protein CutC [Bacteroidaceae bacterium]|nr:copper homeostasis protein CutC [Bacteroidaceae bacterium]
MDLEICAGTWQSAVAAAEGGAQRIELCSALADGGLTPSVGLIRQAVTLKDCLNVHVLIRPRSGDFVYTEQETEIMADDIRTAVECGVDGVVIGALTPDGDVDVEVCRRLVEAARGVKNITFHRAFDMCRNPESALEQVIALGCNRLLTSGLAPTAETGIPMLRRLVLQADGRLSVMPGCGVGTGNARRILDESGAREIHASARGLVPSVMRYRNESVNMGTPGQDEFSRWETDPQVVRQIRASLNE